ncbi:MAG TPA: FixH family protein, partial [Phycisphaerales bacterium]|nr:FixH family protein [Phycisphaerales bacterium]
NACIVAATVVCATRDKSFAIEPGYYRKAVEWDRTARERDRAAAAGWDVQVALAGPAAGPGASTLRITLHGPAPGGATPLDGAQVQVEMFAQARSSERQTFWAEGAGAGAYTAPVSVQRPGLWEVRLRIKRGPESLLFVRTLVVPGTTGPETDR